MLTLIRRHGDVPFCCTSVFLPPPVGALLGNVPELAAPGCTAGVTVIGLIDTRMARSLKGAEQSITAAARTKPASRAAGWAGRATGAGRRCGSGRPR